MVTAIDGVPVSGTVAAPGEVTVVPRADVPRAVASLLTEPLSTSACRTVYMAVAVTDCPGFSAPVAPGQAPNVMFDRPGS